jgi:hypothetical protein
MEYGIITRRSLYVSLKSITAATSVQPMMANYQIGLVHGQRKKECLEIVHFAHKNEIFGCSYGFATCNKITYKYLKIHK